MSIYHKVCPACAASVPRDIETCECGYSFVADADSSSMQDEELYLNYLNARIDQLVANVDVARAALAERPSSFERALAVMRAVSALRAARDDITAQEEKLQTIGGEMETADRSSPSSTIDAVESSEDEETTNVFGEQSLEAVRSHAPGSAFRALQAARAAKVVSGANRECPNCHAPNPIDATRCSCGFALAPVTLPDVGDSADPRPSRK